VGATIPSVSSDRSLAELERDEINRSALEASKFNFTGIDPSQVERYLDPPANTPYPLEYAFHLLGDIRCKTVVDLGCGKGENIVVLATRGGDAIGIDISPDLVQLALQRLAVANVSARAIVGSAYDTGFNNESVDIIFCSALVHHLDIPRVRNEMYRILRKDGFVVLSEPVRFSKVYDRLRKILPAQEDTSPFEHPLTMRELECLAEGFTWENQRLFRLPFVAISPRLFHRPSPPSAWIVSDWMIHACSPLEHFATTVVAKLRKRTL
jgi:SAM-dependent methyltransferase